MQKTWSQNLKIHVFFTTLGKYGKMAVTPCRLEYVKNGWNFDLYQYRQPFFNTIPKHIKFFGVSYFNFSESENPYYGFLFIIMVFFYYYGFFYYHVFFKNYVFFIMVFFIMLFLTLPLSVVAPFKSHFNGCYSRFKSLQWLNSLTI